MRWCFFLTFGILVLSSWAPKRIYRASGLAVHASGRAIGVCLRSDNLSDQIAPPEAFARAGLGRSIHQAKQARRSPACRIPVRRATAQGLDAVTAEGGRETACRPLPARRLGI